MTRAKFSQTNAFCPSGLSRELGTQAAKTSSSSTPWKGAWLLLPVSTLGHGQDRMMLWTSMTLTGSDAQQSVTRVMLKGPVVRGVEVHGQCQRETT